MRHIASEAHRELGSLAHLGFNDQPCTMARQNMLDDGKPEAGALLRTAVFNADAIEALRQARHVFGGNTRPFVDNADFDGLAFSFLQWTC